MRRLLIPALAWLVLALAGCAGSTGSAPLLSPEPIASPGPSGDLSKAAMAALLLQPNDLPELPVRREFASAELTSQATPQLALCRPSEPVGPHELANVLAKSGKIGTAQIFQVVAAFADAAAAADAYAGQLAAARECTTFTQNGRSFRVQDLAPLPARADATGFHYRLTTPDVGFGDVRTVARKGRFTVLVTGFGQPPAGQTLLGFQAAAMTKALDRLPS